MGRKEENQEETQEFSLPPASPNPNWVFLSCFSQIRKFRSPYQHTAGGGKVSACCRQGGELSGNFLVRGYLGKTFSASAVVEDTVRKQREENAL